MRALRSLATEPSSHVTTIALTCTRTSILEGCFDPGRERTWFLNLVAVAAPTSRAVLQLLLPGFSWDGVEFLKKKCVYRETHSFLEFAHDVLVNDFVVSRQRPL